MASPNTSFSREELLAWASEHVGLANLDITRLSSVLLAQLIAIERHRFVSIFSITDELQAMEGYRRAQSTEVAGPFHGKVLKGLHKKHFTDARFMAANLAAHFYIGKGGNARLTEVVQQAFDRNTSGFVDDQFCCDIAQLGTIDALRERACERQLTGEWIIFHQHEGRNFYLTLAAHSEDDRDILKRVQMACSFDKLPFSY